MWKSGSCQEDFWKVAEVQTPQDGEVGVPTLAAQPKYILWCWGGVRGKLNYSEPSSVSCSWESNSGA